MQVKLFGMENRVWNQKYANEIKSKLDIAGEKGHLIANKNSEMRNRRKRMNETERPEHQWAEGQQQTAWNPFNGGPSFLGENGLLGENRKKI